MQAFHKRKEMLHKSFSSSASRYTSNEIHRGSMPDELSTFSRSAAQANYADDRRERIIYLSESKGRLYFQKRPKTHLGKTNELFTEYSFQRCS
jgi:hypothetical protein